MSRKSYFGAIVAAFFLSLGFCSACSGKDNPTTVPETDEGKSDIEVVDGKVRFYLDISGDSVREGMGIAWSNWARVTVCVNGKDYKPSLDNGRWCIDVNESSAGSYTATATVSGSDAWYGNTAYTDLKLPYSQFAGDSKSAFETYPMYASYSKENGNVLEFSDAFAALDLALTGSAKIVSIKVSNPKGAPIAGYAGFLPSKNQMTVTEGVDFAVLNCTNNGKYISLGSTPRHFHIILAATGASTNLDVTICDSNRKVMRFSVNASLVPGKLTLVEKQYVPDENVVFYEGFDTFVWGGDIMSGGNSIGYAPDSKAVGIDCVDREGYVDAFAKVACDVPGSGFIQSNTWADCSGKTVGRSHVQKDSYILSRNISDYTYMFRCQEYQGCISVGAANNSRGIFQTNANGNVKGFVKAKVSFDFCFQAGITDALLFQLMNGGMIESVSLNGKAVELSHGDSFGYKGNASFLVTSNKSVTVPSSNVEAKQWNRMELVVNGVTDGTALYFAGNDANSGVHGFYLDNLEIRVLETSYERKPGALRVLYWNIQNGMWSDQANNYDNFVKWVKSYDPDICVWCESATIYKDNTNSGQAQNQRFLPDGWSSLAARYGHAYTAVGGWRDNYPQTITSKYPIETLLRITDTDDKDKPVTHGAAVHKVTVNGTSVNFITLHTWPQAYAYGDASKNTADNAGDRYREYEMQYIIAHTYNSPEFSGQRNWLMMGDFNSRSPRDEWFYNYGSNSDPKYLVHNHIINNTDLVDIIWARYPDCFITTTYGSARIDYMYASPAMYDMVDHSLVLMDKWTSSSQSPYVSNFYDPSDHRPILTDFILK